MTVRWPRLFTNDNLKRISLSFSGNVKVTKNGNDIKAKGTLEATSGSEEETFDFDVTLNAI